jgi:hypothetical protein
VDSSPTDETGNGRGWNIPAVITIGVILVVVAIGYIAWHLYLYRNCFFSPSLMDWPSSCL